MALTRKQIDDAPVKTDEVPVSELVENETVHVRRLDSDGLMVLIDLVNETEGKPERTERENVEVLYRCAALLVSDAKGARLYKDDESGAFKNWPFPALERVVEEGMKLNNMDSASAARRTQELTRPLAGSGSSSRGNGRARLRKRKPARPRKRSSSASR